MNIKDDLRSSTICIIHVFYSVYHQIMTYYTSIIAIPRGGAGSRQPIAYSLVASCEYGQGRLSKLVEESHVAFVWNRGGCGNLGFRV